MNINYWIKKKFGSKKGMLRFFYHQLLLKLGFYRRYKNIDFTKINRLVFACSGNICRSPFAEAAARKYGINSISFGLDTRGGDPADPRAIDIGNKMQLDLTSHRTKRIEQYFPLEGDLLIIMEPQHLKMIPESLSGVPVTILGLWLKKQNAYIHDPYNSCDQYFEDCERLVIFSVNGLIENLVIQ